MTVLLIGSLGFDFSKRSIPVEEILSGGPPKDGIPAILNPIFVGASQADFLSDSDRVLGLVRGKEAKAYPIKILNWHEIVNDTIGDAPVLVSYCPLCGTGMAFDPVVQDRRLTFGVSGLLYKSDVLMYDHQTESLWSQIKQEAVTGAMTGTGLRLLPLVHTDWGSWRREHPGAEVLSTKTGFHRDYSRDPYADYAKSPRLMFPAGAPDGRLGPKEWVIGIEIDGTARAYPFSELAKGAGRVHDRVGAKEIEVLFDRAAQSAIIKDRLGNPLPVITAYWFAWSAFYPKTEIYHFLK